MLRRVAGGVPLVALHTFLTKPASASSASTAEGHPPPRARSVIFLFMGGGPSQMDTFDPKPALAKYKDVAIKPPEGVGALRDAPKLKSFPSPWKFKRHGRSGLWVSELFPFTAECADDLCVIRSMYCDQLEHAAAIRQFVTGDALFSRPSVGSWLLYGLGTESENLPGFVCFAEQGNLPGTPLLGSSFLPAVHQGVRVPSSALKKGGKQPIANLKLPVPASIQSRKIRAIRDLNRLNAGASELDSRLDARIASYELAVRMQMEAPEAFDLSRETAATRELYGIDHPDYDNAGAPCFAKQCLLARRLVERGVRVVLCNVNNQWDAHGNLKGNHTSAAMWTDRAVAALVTDLKRRGLLEETLVVWGGEFGRTPQTQGSDGRDHHPYGYTVWMAGGGVKGGITHGATDDFGFYATENKVHVHDLHATILHVLGVDHTRLTFRYGGRDYRLTDVYGEVVEAILA